jgi:hypothetical protein
VEVRRRDERRDQADQVVVHVRRVPVRPGVSVKTLKNIFP